MRIFLFATRVQTGVRAHPASYPMGTVSSTPKGKVAGRESDHILPSSSEVKNVCSYTSSPLYVSKAWCLVKHRKRQQPPHNLGLSTFRTRTHTFEC
jgi:hypothetical protein